LSSQREEKLPLPAELLKMGLVKHRARLKQAGTKVSNEAIELLCVL